MCVFLKRWIACSGCTNWPRPHISSWATALDFAMVSTPAGLWVSLIPLSLDFLDAMSFFVGESKFEGGISKCEGGSSECVQECDAITATSVL